MEDAAESGVTARPEAGEMLSVFASSQPCCSSWDFNSIIIFPPSMCELFCGVRVLSTDAEQITWAAPFTGLLDQCSTRENWSKSYTFDDLSTFYVEQQFHKAAASTAWTERVKGRILLSQGQSDQTADVEAVVSVKASNQWIIDHLEVGTTEQSLVLDLPLIENQDSCLEYTIELALKPDLELEKFGLRAGIGDISIDGGLKLFVNDTTKIETNIGSIHSENLFDSIRASVNARTGHISGYFTVQQNLEIGAVVGNVDAHIAPNSTRPASGKPAVVFLSSAIGTVAAKYPWEGFGHLEERPYYTFVKTEKGVIKGEYLLGAETILSSQVGTIQADVVPYIWTEKSKLTTTSTTGTQHVNVRLPTRANISSIDNLISSHTAGTGSLHLEYPVEWTGSMHGVTLTGDIKVDGDFDDFEKGTRGAVGKWVKARRGDGSSDLSFATTTGSASLALVDDRIYF